MINQSYISVLAITLGLSAASGVNALEIANGLSTNGLSTNGLSTNGLSTNGLSTNGRDAKGAVSSSMRLEAAILQDGSVILLGD
jgi:hypothetical protein